MTAPSGGLMFHEKLSVTLMQGKSNCVSNHTQFQVTRVSFEAFTGVIFQIEVFWVVTPCSVLAGYQPTRLKMKAAWIFKTLLSYYNTTRHHNPENLNLLHR
jgi:hypothetical protein